MNPFGLAWADFLERSRRTSFLITLGAMLYAAYVFMPAKDAGYTTIDLDGWRGVYNSAWVGTSVAMLGALFLSLIGFHVVKNALDRDRKTRVGEVLATTLMPNSVYLVGKWLSHVFVLGSMVLVLIVAAAAMQWLRREAPSLDLWVLVAPFLIITLPALVVSASFAVLFETIPLLRGSIGNVIWLFLWMFVFVNPASLDLSSSGAAPPFWMDGAGCGLVVSEMTNAAALQVAGYERSHLSIGINIGNSVGQTFPWRGIDWTGDIIAGRFAWMMGALLVVFAAVPFFDRFDPARDAARKGKRRPAAAPGAVSAVPAEASLPAAQAVGSGLTRPGRIGFQLPAMLAAEIVLAVKGYRLWWYLVAVGLFAAGLFAPLSVARHFWPFAWIWPLPIWANLGCREARYGTMDLLFASPHPLRRQLPAVIAAGIAVALATGGAQGIRYLAAGNGPGVLAWAIGAAFVATFATAAGIWTGSGRLFEVVHLLLWYMGPLQGFGALDFMAITPDSAASRAPVTFGCLSLVFAGLATLGRKRSLEGDSPR